ncbi:MAG: HAD family hydrolase [Thermoplasmatota archaeon]
MKVISFDVDGTLLDKHFGDAFWREEIPKLYADQHGVPIEDAKEMIFKHYDEVGDDDIRWYLPEYWFDKYNLKGDPKEILHQMDEEVKIYSDTKKVLSKLHDKYQLIVVSNAAKMFLDIELKDLKDYFSHVFSCTSDFKMVKKDPKVYLKVCEMLELNPSDVVHVGDHERYDYLAAKDMGMTAYLVDRDGDKDNAMKDLTELLNLLE